MTREQNRKSRMISLRLSAEEYEALRALYPSYGARNLSHFVRLAMQQLIGGPVPPANRAVAEIEKLDERLSAVEERLATLFKRQKETA